MYIVIVQAQVKPEFVEAFIAASRDNASNSIQEPGIARFDFLQQKDDPTRFVLYEVYQTPEDAPKHRETAHYLRWRAAADPMMATERTRIEYVNLEPDDSGF
ncbi:MAG TPA: antibiotic biosynthesis monooxygenase [Aggregatilineales bacterium]|jgi:quinol monooxygenase YgiN|nr:antibiotic biosynthesis monooxygenase [Aggregatilineales bacterium]